MTRADVVSGVQVGLVRLPAGEGRQVFFVVPRHNTRPVVGLPARAVRVDAGDAHAAVVRHFLHLVLDAHLRPVMQTFPVPLGAVDAFCRTEVAQVFEHNRIRLVCVREGDDAARGVVLDVLLEAVDAVPVAGCGDFAGLALPLFQLARHLAQPVFFYRLVDKRPRDDSSVCVQDSTDSRIGQPHVDRADALTSEGCVVQFDVLLVGEAQEVLFPLADELGIALLPIQFAVLVQEAPFVEVLRLEGNVQPYPVVPWHS